MKLNDVPGVHFSREYSFYINKFIMLILENAPQIRGFDPYEIFIKTNPNEIDEKRFKALYDEIIAEMLRLRLVIKRENDFMVYIDRRQEFFDKHDLKQNESATTYVYNINGNSQIIQDSHFENSSNALNVNSESSNNKTESVWQKIWKWTDHKVIAQIIVILLGAILAYFGYTMLK